MADETLADQLRQQADALGGERGLTLALALINASAVLLDRARAEAGTCGLSDQDDALDLLAACDGAAAPVRELVGRLAESVSAALEGASGELGAERERLRELTERNDATRAELGEVRERTAALPEEHERLRQGYRDALAEYEDLCVAKEKYPPERTLALNEQIVRLSEEVDDASRKTAALESRRDELSGQLEQLKATLAGLEGEVADVRSVALGEVAEALARVAPALNMGREVKEGVDRLRDDLRECEEIAAGYAAWIDSDRRVEDALAEVLEVEPEEDLRTLARTIGVKGIPRMRDALREAERAVGALDDLVSKAANALSDDRAQAAERARR